ncbi:hypothetical protein LOCC1_G006769 [Lachnellula occidentalis]|uniref:ABM domain-containing protein n=1 Tax=Lachnellula occidentalis TaxID=215460 RepID=A0A8H8UC58_9HELO|nr:hypothetical protein LOCC1_G006769 [Lachnellula occidentalis]
MTLIQIIHLTADPSATTPEVIKALKDVETPQHFVLGTQIQDKTAIQITSEWDDVQDPSSFKTTPKSSSFTQSLSSLYGIPTSIFHINLDRSVFGPGGSATANVVEYVQSWFPASRATPGYQKQIEADFARFNEIISKGVQGRVGLASGWVLEEQEHADIEGGKAKCFVAVVGWESMNAFEESLKRDAFKEAIPLLMAWNMPAKMWHVERKILDGEEVGA